MKTKKCNYTISQLTDKEINGVKMTDGSVDKTTIIGKQGDYVCLESGKVFREV